MLPAAARTWSRSAPSCSCGCRAPEHPLKPEVGAIQPRDAVLTTYTDAFGVRRAIPADAIAAVAAAMGPGPARGELDPVRIGRPGQLIDPPADLTLEEGAGLGTVDRIPRGIPNGYHRLRRDEGEQLLLTPPRRCRLPTGYRAWAFAVQLYAARSSRSWGIGDLVDLRTLGAWARARGADALLVNPFWAPNPGPEPEPSPYYPSTRRFRDPLLLRVEDVPGAARLGAAELGELAAAARRLNEQPRIDRGWVIALKLEALGRIWQLNEGSAATDSSASARLTEFRAEQGTALRGWATFAALTERLGPGWRAWPEPYRDPHSPAVAAFAAEHVGRVAFHEWIQWLIDEQLRVAAAEARLIGDLPVGFDPGGFDAWAWQRELTTSATIGAPPDRFNARGQDWGLPPFIPHRLRASGHRPFIETVRAALCHAGGLRIDHVLGLFRLWWVPAGASPADGAYVRYPADELLAILAIESERAAALVIGEDLGTVEAGVRRTLAAHNVLSTRLVYFERRRPPRYPRLTLAGVTTHDLPTVAGTWSGADLRDQAAAGLDPDPAGLAVLRRRLAAAAGGLQSDAEPREAILRVHEALAASPSMLVSATLEDALAVEVRPNIPGTTTTRANWSMALPLSVEELMSDAFVQRLTRAMRR